MSPTSWPIRIAVMALVDDRRVLLVHRHPGRANYPDCWDLPGGHVEPGETPADAARRECLEELGVEVIAASPFPMTCSDPALRKHAFVATRWTGSPLNLAPDEHDALGWFTTSELSDLSLAHPALLPFLLGLLVDQ